MNKKIKGYQIRITKPDYRSVLFFFKLFCRGFIFIENTEKKLIVVVHSVHDNRFFVNVKKKSVIYDTTLYKKEEECVCMSHDKIF